MTPKNPNDPNIVMLQRVANRLGAQLFEGLVFVGGAAAQVHQLPSGIQIKVVRAPDFIGKNWKLFMGEATMTICSATISVTSSV